MLFQSPNCWICCGSSLLFSSLPHYPQPSATCASHSDEVESQSVAFWLKCGRRGVSLLLVQVTTWWLCRVHDFSRSSRQQVLALTNYVLVQGDDFMMADMRPHGLIELVLGHRQIVFPTFVPRWINLPILQTFLAPLVSRTHFGITAHGSYNGDRIGNRLMLCESGFFIQLHIQATGFLLGELYSNAPLQAMTLHAASYHPSAYDVRRSTVHIAGG